MFCVSRDREGVVRWRHRLSAHRVTPPWPELGQRSLPLPAQPRDGVGHCAPPAGPGGGRFVGGLPHLVPVQGQDLWSGQWRKVRETIHRRHEVAGERRVEFVAQGQTASTAGGSEIGFPGDRGRLALTCGLEPRASRGRSGVNARDTQRDELGVGESEVMAVVVECRA